MNRFESTCLGQIQARRDPVRDCRVLVACSGGGDSVALLAFLWAVRRNLGLDLVVAHGNHGLRPEAGEDAAFVAALCRHLDLDLVEARLDVKRHAKASGQGLETAARELRWEWLRAEMDSCGAAYVATGHTLEDHTETVLLRMARGGGLGSLTPLPAFQPPRWSPLIEARRHELRAYLRQRNLPWREDTTNAKPFTARNRWRSLLEAIRKEAPGLDRHLWETHRQVEELRELRDLHVAAQEASRWRLEQDGLRLKGPFEERELRWILEAAFRRAGWPREADLLRDLTAWALPILGRKTRKRRVWGGWTLEPSEGELPWLLVPGAQ